MRVMRIAKLSTTCAAPASPCPLLQRLPTNPPASANLCPPSACACTAITTGRLVGDCAFEECKGVACACGACGPGMAVVSRPDCKCRLAFVVRILLAKRQEDLGTPALLQEGSKWQTLHVRWECVCTAPCVLICACLCVGVLCAVCRCHHARAGWCRPYDDRDAAQKHTQQREPLL